MPLFPPKCPSCGKQEPTGRYYLCNSPNCEGLVGHPPTEDEIENSEHLKSVQKICDDCIEEDDADGKDPIILIYHFPGPVVDQVVPYMMHVTFNDGRVETEMFQPRRVEDRVMIRDEDLYDLRNWPENQFEDEEHDGDLHERDA